MNCHVCKWLGKWVKNGENLIFCAKWPDRSIIGVTDCSACNVKEIAIPVLSDSPAKFKSELVDLGYGAVEEKRKRGNPNWVRK